MDAQAFKALRVEMKLTQAGLARELDMNEATVANYESERSEIPRAIALAMETLIDRARKTPRKTRADYETQFANLLEIERLAAERMRAKRPWTEHGKIIIPSIENTKKIEEWERYRRAWEDADRQLREFVTEFRKALSENRI